MDYRALAAAIAAFWLATTDSALACACCSNRASRYVETETLGDVRRNTIEQMSFAGDAFVAESAADHPDAIQELGTTLQLQVTQTREAIVFSFRGQRDRETVLTLALPDTISIFEVDPRGDTRDDGLGPVLYKEWQLTAATSATGVLQPVIEDGDRKVTLILHGRGRGCTDAAEFTDWTLLVRGAPDRVVFYGALTR